MSRQPKPLTEALQACDMDREPTPDEQAGIDWWNRLTEVERAFWFGKAGGTGSAADAWEAYKREQVSGRPDE